MPRNRRNTRRIKLKEFLNLRTFLTIIGILLAVIIVCIGINAYRVYQDRRLIAEQNAEIEKQSQEIFSQINSNIEQTNKNISESDVLISMSAVGDILCSNEMLEDAYDENTKT